jgi:hypothetical protein
MTNPIPWWLHSLLKRYVPIYALQLLEHPWIITWIAGTILALKIIVIMYLIYRVISERKQRKNIEREYSFLAERYEHLKILHLQHQTMTTLLMAHKKLSDGVGLSSQHEERATQPPQQ